MKHTHRLRQLEQKQDAVKVKYQICWCPPGKCDCKFDDTDTVVRVVYWDDDEGKELPYQRTHPTNR